MDRNYKSTLKPLQYLFCWAVLVLLAGVSGCGPASVNYHRVKADEHVKNKNYQRAIEEYWKHIAERLAIRDRPEWENPYLYLLDIGDIHLEQGDVAEALRHYELAEEKEVKQRYVNDRYRYIARWYEQHGELEKALEHLKLYRDKDPLLFDLMLDRIAKLILERENRD